MFDKGGKSLFFAVSTDVGLSAGWLDLSSFQHPVLRNIYAAVLKKGDPSPVEPQSDEEKAADEKKDAADKGKDADKSKEGDKGKGGDKAKEGDKGKDGEKKEEAVKVTIDLDGIGQRIVALPIKAANYVGLDAGKAGTLFLSEIVDVPRFDGPTPVTVSKFDLTTRKTEPFVGGINGFAVSANGEKVLYRQGPGWFITGTAVVVKPGDGALNLAEMEVYVDPRAEWNQMYHEVWRIERDFLYDPNHHGLDIPATEKKYAALFEGLGRTRGSELSLRRNAGRSHHRPHVHRRWRRSAAEASARADCSARTTRSKTAATVLRAFTTARIGIPICVRR